MNTLKSYIHEGLFSQDSIDDQIDKNIEINIVNKFRNIYYKDVFLKNLEKEYVYRYDTENNILHISVQNKKPIYFNTNLIDEFDFNIQFEGETNEFIMFLNNARMKTDKKFTEQVNSLIKNITIHNFGIESNIFKKDYEINELDLNLGGNNRFMCRIDYFVKGTALDFKNLNIIMKDQCNLIIELMSIDSINNINFSNNSKKCNKLVLCLYNPFNMKLSEKEINKLKQMNKIFSEIEIRSYENEDNYMQDIHSSIIINKSGINYK